MAAIAQELADSLTQDEIPIKLRCASCNRLTVNAFRLPCCDQNVCGSCQTTLPDTCPVCMHSPLSADDCKPNKSLRLTVKAFLKNEEKKRDKIRADAALVKAAAIQNEAAEEAERPASAQIPDAKQPLTEDAPKVDNIVQSIETEDQIQPEQQTSTESQSAIPNDDSSLVEQDRPRDSASVEIITGDGENESVARSAAPADTSTTQNRDEGTSQDQQAGHNMSNGQTESTNGYNASNNMFNGNNNFNGVNPMMMANSMGMNGMNGMNSMNWGGFNPMMGMGMDPNMMMYGGFNGQGMGYNGMNMGMMGNGGGYGNWGGQMGGMNGNFGANAGYYPNSGYNQQSHRGGHFNHMSQRNSSHSMNNNRFGQSQRFAQNAYDRNLDVQGQVGHHQTNGGDTAQTEQVQAQVVSNEPNKSDETKPPAEEANRDTPVISAGDIEVTGNTDVVRDHEGQVTNAPDANSASHQDEQTSNTANTEFVGQSQPILSAANPDNASVEPQGVTVLDTSDTPLHMTGDQGVGPDINMLPVGSSPQFMPNGYNGYNEFSGRGRGGWRGRGRVRGGFGRGGYGFEVVTPLTPSEPLGTGVAGAPTGPKAMRDGAPVPAFRGRGGFAPRGGRGGTFGMAASPVSATESAIQTGEPSHSIDAVRDPARRSRSETRSPTRHRSHRRRRSESVGQDAKQQDDETLDEYGRTKKRRRHSDKDDNNEQVRDEAIVVEPVNHEHETVTTVVDHDSERSRESRHRSRKHRSSRHDKDRSRSPEHSRDHSQHRSRDQSRRHTPERSERSSRRHKHRSRSRSPRRESDEHTEKDSKHRSHRDREHDKKDRRREDKDRRSDRDRDDRDKDRDHDKDHHHRRSHRDHSAERPHSSRDETKQVPNDMRPPPAPERVAPGSLAPPSAPKGPSGVREFKIQGRSRMAAPPIVPPTPPRGPGSRSNSFSSNTGATKVPVKEQVRAERPEVDAHTLEREARNRDRMLKEAQRMSLLMNRGQAGKPAAGSERTARKEKDKRSRRRGSGKFEEEDAEARARRVEEEREAERWN